MKEKLGIRIFKNFGIFFLYIYSIELIIRLNTQSPLFDWASFRIALSSAILAILIALIISVNNKLWCNIGATLFAIFIMFYAWIEVNLFNYLGFFMGTGNAEQGAKVTDYINDYIKASKFTTYLVIIPFAILILYYWWVSKKIRMRKLNKTVCFKFKVEKPLNVILTHLIIFLILIVLSLSYYATLKLKFMQPKLQSVKNTNLFIYPENSNLSVSQFGTLVYGATDLYSQIFDIVVYDDFDFGDHDNNNSNESTNPDFKRYIDDYAWNQVILNEKNATYNRLNNYLINREITSKNEYTGIFEGKNLIVILMESVNEIAIYSEEYFPTLYKLYNEGISFRNNYTPQNSCSTGNNEMTAMTSLFTINNTCTVNTYKNNKYFQAIFNQFNNIGYQTSSYHNYVEFYYSRRTIHPNMGSMKYRNASDLNIKWSSIYEQWPSDVDLIEKSFPYFINEDRFMAFLTTVSTHQPYSISSNMGDKHSDLFKNTNYSRALKRYLSKMKELDLALARLLEKLEEAGKLENTVIALFADHYPYGLTNNQINEFLPYDVKVRKEQDRTPMVIYNSGIKPETIYKYTSIIDLLPTLLNMFNLEYDPRLYFGHDIFSDNTGRVIFAEGSWQDAVGYYSSTSGKFTPINDEGLSYTDDELKEINSQINTMQKMSSLAIRNNYFNYLNKSLAKYAKQEEIETLIIGE